MLFVVFFFPFFIVLLHSLLSIIVAANLTRENCTLLKFDKIPSMKSPLSDIIAAEFSRGEFEDLRIATNPIFSPRGTPSCRYTMYHSERRVKKKEKEKKKEESMSFIEKCLQRYRHAVVARHEFIIHDKWTPRESTCDKVTRERQFTFYFIAACILKQCFIVMSQVWERPLMAWIAKKFLNWQLTTCEKHVRAVL